MRICVADGCENPAYCRGYCGIHYSATRRGESVRLKPEEVTKPERPPWQYENPMGESELAEKYR